MEFIISNAFKVVRSFIKCFVSLEKTLLHRVYEVMMKNNLRFGLRRFF